MNGVLIIDKPPGFTSHDVVNRVRRILEQRSVGHLGTLDPLATGVLPIVFGSLTRLAQFYTGSEKRYEGTIRFGFATDTYDAEGEATSEFQAVATSLENLQQLAQRFHGSIEQAPPPFSAKKIQGVPAYKLARKKKEVKLAPVQIEMFEFEIMSYANERATFPGSGCVRNLYALGGSRSRSHAGLRRPSRVIAANRCRGVCSCGRAYAGAGRVWLAGRELR